MHRPAPALALFTLVALAPACAVYDGPPDVTLDGAKGGLLADPAAPIVLDFSKAPVPSSVKLTLAPYMTGGAKLFSHDPKAGDVGGTASFSADKKKLSIKLPVAPPAGARYVVTIAPGMADDLGAVTKVERQIVFGYELNLNCNAPTALFAPGYYFILVNVTNPIPVQVKLFADIKVDLATGQLQGRFTDAYRNRDNTRCAPPVGPCSAADVCRLLPAPECVAPSTRADSVDEFSDFVPNPGAPTGFSFAAHGCAVDQGSQGVTFSTAPVDVEVLSPHVILRNAAMSALFKVDASGVLRATGSLAADAVLLGTIDSGKGQGDLTARSITKAEAPPGIPKP